MCISISGRILELYDGTALVEVMGNRLNVSTRLVSPRVGDFVLIHAGCAIDTINAEQADELAALHREIGEIMRDD